MYVQVQSALYYLHSQSAQRKMGVKNPEGVGERKF
jgi:hypothetical protein